MNELIKKLELLKSGNKDTIIVGIDGSCCSGKTTLSLKLAKEFDCNVFHADDFFLRPEQRTNERLAQPGGNMDRERLLSEILIPLKKGNPVTFQSFSCQTMSLLPSVTVPKKQINIVEGAYCLHPELWDFYDLRVFVNAPWEVRIQRLKDREQGDIDNFLNRWIPLENQYFDTYKIEDRVDIVLTDI